LVYTYCLVRVLGDMNCYLPRTLDIQAPRKPLTEAPHLSKDEMCFNLSLSISVQVSTTIGSHLLSAPDPKQSSSLSWTLVRRVWAEEATWHHSYVEVVGS
jgi:hypothetical protein